MANLSGTSTEKDVPGVSGENADGNGVRGMSKSGTGVLGTSESGVAVWGGSQSSSGVGGMSDSGIGVHGVSQAGPGVRGDAEHGDGVLGVSKTHTGVHGISETGEGIHGETTSPTVAAIAAFNLNPTGTGAAIYAEKQGDVGHAGFFKGNVHVTGTLTADTDLGIANADCAEDFDIADADLIEPGTVMVLGDEGAVHQSHQPYDKRVAGVVSGAGEYKPGIVLDKQQSERKRQPIALLGKVYCKVDAHYGANDVGDLLTTSPTPGHAMKTSDPVKAFGAVIGKALQPWPSGQGLIPILIALQ